MTIPTSRPILLVEDRPQDRELIQIALARCQVANEIVVANDGADALDYIYRKGRFADGTLFDPAVVLLDLNMPKVNGLEVLVTIKSDPATRHIPVVMLTSSREERDLTQSYENGVNSYVVKPTRFSEYVGAIQNLAGFWTVLNSVPPGRLEPRPNIH